MPPPRSRALAAGVRPAAPGRVGPRPSAVLAAVGITAVPPAPPLAGFPCFASAAPACGRACCGAGGLRLVPLRLLLPRRRARRQHGASLDACSCPVLPGLPLRCVLPAAWRLLVWGPPALVAAPPPPAQGRVGWRTRRTFYLLYTFLSISTCLFSVWLALLANTE